MEPTTGEIVPLGTPGELLIRGACVMHGYWDDPEKTSQAISQDRWYRTGYVNIYLNNMSNWENTEACCVIFFLRSDTASLNSLGYCRIEGRLKDMIIRGGENIYPAEIEQFLFTHPKVQEVQVRLKTTGGQQRHIKAILSVPPNVLYILYIFLL